LGCRSFDTIGRCCCYYASTRYRANNWVAKDLSPGTLTTACGAANFRAGSDDLVGKGEKKEKVVNIRPWTAIKLCTNLVEGLIHIHSDYGRKLNCLIERWEYRCEWGTFNRLTMGAVVKGVKHSQCCGCKLL
jgi:hypothetical protein